MRNYASFLIYLQNMKNFKLTLLTAAVRFLAMFPLKVHYFWADVIAWVLRSVVGYRRDVVAINMGRSFPSTACYYDDIERFSKLYYRHMAEIIVEEMGLKDVKFSYTGGEGGWKGDVPRFQYDLTKIHNAGWQAAHTSDEAVRLTTQEYLKELDR